jgi:hypothetical protein
MSAAQAIGLIVVFILLLLGWFAQELAVGAPESTRREREPRG